MINTKALARLKAEIQQQKINELENDLILAFNKLETRNQEMKDRADKYKAQRDMIVFEAKTLLKMINNNFTINEITLCYCTMAQAMAQLGNVISKIKSDKGRE